MTFAPVLFTIANIPTADPAALIEKITEPLKDQTVPLDTGFMFDFGALTFVNKHPEASEVLVEVQAHSAEANEKAVGILTKVIIGIEEAPMHTWHDVTEEAIAYHAKLAETQE